MKTMIPNNEISPRQSLVRGDSAVTLPLGLRPLKGRAMGNLRAGLR